MSWCNEPATEGQLSRLRQLDYSADCLLTKGEAAYLIRVLEEQPEAPGSEVHGGGQHLSKQVVYALRLSVEHTRRALAEAPSEQAERLQQSLSLAAARRAQFWIDTCCELTQMKSHSTAIMDLYMKYGCRFSPPSREQVQEVLDALDMASPVWDRDNPNVFYTTLELNFAQLMRQV